MNTDTVVDTVVSVFICISVYKSRPNELYNILDKYSYIYVAYTSCLYVIRNVRIPVSP